MHQRTSVLKDGTSLPDVELVHHGRSIAHDVDTDHKPRPKPLTGGMPAGTPIGTRRRPSVRAISGPLAPVIGGISRLLTDRSPRRSGCIKSLGGTDSQADNAGSIPVTRSNRKTPGQSVVLLLGRVMIMPHSSVPVSG